VAAALRWLPWVAAALGAWVLLCRLRPLPSLLLAAVFTTGTLVGGLAGLLWVGMSEAGRRRIQDNPGELGVGLQIVTVSAALAILAAIFGVRRSNWWLAYLLSLGLTLGALIAFASHVRG
jgi:hypothetical protein